MKEENKIFFQVYSVEGLFMGWVASWKEYIWANGNNKNVKKIN